MPERTTVEVDPLILRALKIIARRYKLKVKTVSDGIFRFGIPHAKKLFAGGSNNNNKKEKAK